MQPHQQRVVEEFDELEERLGKLGRFIATSDQYQSLPPQEQKRLCMQQSAMNLYHYILAERILNFPTSPTGSSPEPQ